MTSRTGASSVPGWAWFRARTALGARPSWAASPKAGDGYLRTLLVLGARALLLNAPNKTDPVSRWALQLKERVGYGKAVVAIAAKNARMCWAVLNLGEGFRVPA